MSRKFSASMEFQRPDGGDIPSLRPLCPVCRAPVEIYTVYSGGQISEQPRCRAHGDVVAVYAHPRLTPPISEVTTMPGNVWDGEGP